MSGYQDTANRARAAGAKSSPPKPSLPVRSTARSAALTSATARAADARNKSKSSNKPSSTKTPFQQREAAKLADMEKEMNRLRPNSAGAKAAAESGKNAAKTGSKFIKGAKVGARVASKAAVPLTIAVGAAEIAAEGKARKEEGWKRGFHERTTMGAGGYGKSEQVNSKGQKWSDVRRSEKSPKSDKPKSTATAYAMGTSGGPRVSTPPKAQEAAKRRASSSYNPMEGTSTKGLTGYAKRSVEESNKDVSRYKRIAAGAYKGKYYGPDEFKGNLKLLKAWRVSGSPKDTKAFAKSQKG